MTNIELTRQLILKQSQQNLNATNDLDLQGWWLLGTSGCHLCDDAQRLLTLFTSVHPIHYQAFDIGLFEEAVMMQFATLIPVLLTRTHQLNYPFSILDLQRVYQSDLEG